MFKISSIQNFSRSITFGLVFAASTAALASPTKLVTSGPTGTVEFLAVGKPSLLRVKGKGTGPSADLILDGNKVKGSFAFDLDTLGTGIEMRDRHMKEKYLQTEKFKEARLNLNELTLPAAWTLENPTLENTTFTGTMVLHGVEKPVSGTFSTRKTGSGELSAEAKFDIKITDFAIDIPSYAGITIADQVNVTVSIPSLQPDSKDSKKAATP